MRTRGLDQSGIGESGNLLFPVFLKLQQFTTLVVGGGTVALEKMRALLANCPDARIILVAHRISSDVSALAAQYNGVMLLERRFEARDIEGTSLVLLATDDPRLHHHVYELAKERGIWVNAADTPALCDVYLGAVVKKGNLKIAISTNGKSPTMAVRLKELLQECLPHEIDDTLENLHAFRNMLKGDFAEKVKTLNALTAALMIKEKNR